MVIRRVRKNVKQRAHTTHGWGSMKKRRGAGNRGGRGNAGSGKRGAHKKPRYFDHKRYLGASGFTRHGAKKDVTILNLSMLQAQLDRWVAAGKAKQQGDAYEVDATALGYTKLLGAGAMSKKVTITIQSASAKAQEKVSAAGGSVLTKEGDHVTTG